MSTFGILRVAGEVNFGCGSRHAIAVNARRFGTKAAVIVDPFLRSTDEFAEVLRHIEAQGIHATVVSDVVPELPVDSVVAVADLVRDSEPDVIIGYGGGSALDLAKLVALLLRHPGPLSAYYGENQVPGPVVPLIAVPTTAGTGSEVTPVAVIADPDRELKVGISDPALIPAVAIVDPELTIGAPATVSAHAGIDAFVHAVESVTAGTRQVDWGHRTPVFVGRNRLSSKLGLEALVAIDGSLARVVNNSSDLTAREEMAWGGLVAGMAFGSSGTHLSHALQYPIGALTHTPHGLGTGMMLPYVLQACLSTSIEPLNEIADALSVEEGPRDAARAEQVVDRVEALVKEIGLPSSLQEIGIERSQVPRIAELALGVTRLAGNSTQTASMDLLLDILNAAFDGDRKALR